MIININNKYCKMFSKIDIQSETRELSTPLNFGNGIVWQEFSTHENANLFVHIDKNVTLITNTNSFYLVYAYSNDNEYVFILEHGESHIYKIIRLSKILLKISSDIDIITNGIAISKELKYFYNYEKSCIYDGDYVLVNNVDNIPSSLYSDNVLAWIDNNNNINVYTPINKRLVISKCNFILDYLICANTDINSFVLGGFCFKKSTLVLYNYTYENNIVTKTSIKEYRETAYKGEKLFKMASNISKDGGFYIFVENNGGVIEYQQFNKYSYPIMELTKLDALNAYDVQYDNGICSFISNSQIWWTFL